MSAGTTSRATQPVTASGTTTARTGTARTGSDRPSNRDALRGFLDRPMASFYLVLIFTSALVTIGLVMMLSASSVDSMVKYEGDPYFLFKRQIIWVGLGAVALWLGICLRPSFYRRLSGPLLLFSILLLIVVLVPGIGTEIYGGRRWLDLGPMHLQPSEIAKLAFVLWGADVLVRKQKLLGQWRHLLIPLLPGLIIVGGLVVMEPDLGTTVCYFLIFLALLWTVGTPVRLFVLMFLAVAAAGVAAIVAEPFRMARITSYLNPWADPSDGGLQAVQGLLALGSGGWFGVGLGNSRAKWGRLPNGHSDFIFAIIGEELGLIGGLILLALFVGLAYTGFRIAKRTADPFIRLASAAIVVWMLGQALINVSYVVGLLPVTGIPLPFISSGGTSLVLSMFVMGILASFARHEPDAVKHLQRNQSLIGKLLRLPVPRGAVDGAPRRRASKAQASRAQASRAQATRSQATRSRAAKSQSSPRQTQARQTQARQTQARRSAPAGKAPARKAPSRKAPARRTTR